MSAEKTTMETLPIGTKTNQKLITLHQKDTYSTNLGDVTSRKHCPMLYRITFTNVTTIDNA